MAKYPSIAVGTRVTADLLNSMLPDWIIKQANTARASTTTFADDPDMTVALAANSMYSVEMQINMIADTTADIKTLWTVPTGASGSKFVLGPGTGNDGSDSSTTRFGGSGFGTAIVYGARTGGFSFAVMERAIVTTTNAGNLTLQWAQNVSSATASQVLINSYIRVEQLA